MTQIQEIAREVGYEAAEELEVQIKNLVKKYPKITSFGFKYVSLGEFFVLKKDLRKKAIVISRRGSVPDEIVEGETVLVADHNLNSDKIYEIVDAVDKYVEREHKAFSLESFIDKKGKKFGIALIEV